MTIYSDDPVEPEKGLPTNIAALGIFGLLPFYACMTAAWAGVSMIFGIEPVLGIHTYGAVILSFLGGIRWGLALSPTYVGDRDGDIAGSVVPSLIAWAALLLPPGWGFPVLIFSFVAQLLWDMKAYGSGLIPRWFRDLRIGLTTGAVIAFTLMLPKLG